MKRGLKLFVSVQVEFIKPKVDGPDLVSEPHFRSPCMTIVNVRAPFVIHADLESLTTKVHSVSPDPSRSSSEKFQCYQACGFLCVVVYERLD